ncbi:MAG: hypothetical protein AAF587_04720 [Bacteroidota bacterium]
MNTYLKITLFLTGILLWTPQLSFAQSAAYQGSWYSSTNGIRLDFAPDNLGMISMDEDGSRYAVLYQSEQGSLHIIWDGGDISSYIAGQDGNSMTLVEQGGNNSMLGPFVKQGSHRISNNDLQEIRTITHDEYVQHFGGVKADNYAQDTPSYQEESESSQYSNGQASQHSSSNQSYGTSLNGYYVQNGGQGWMDFHPSGGIKAKDADYGTLIEGLYYYFPEKNGQLRATTSTFHFGEFEIQMQGNSMKVYDRMTGTNSTYRKQGPSRMNQQQATRARNAARNFYSSGEGKDIMYFSIDGYYHHAASGTYLDLAPTASFIETDRSGNITKGAYALDRIGAFYAFSEALALNQGMIEPSGQDLIIDNKRYTYQGPSRQKIKEGKALNERVAAAVKRMESMPGAQAKFHNATMGILNNMTDNTIYVDEFGQRVW